MPHWSELHFDQSSPVPIYRQLCETMAGWIRHGSLSDGTRLPPTRELAGLLGLNRTTVAAAYEALEKEGLLRAHVGRGSFVCGLPQSIAFSWEERFRAPSPDRELSEVVSTADEGGVSFASSRPDPAMFPLDAIRRAVEQELKTEGGAILQLGAAEGYAPLRKWLSEEMRRTGLAGDDDEVLVTTGCQQALDLVAKILVPPGEAVLLEDPVYPGARDLFLAAGAEVHGVAVGPAGIVLSDLEQALARHRPRLLVVTPNFQNPTGATLPLEGRRELLRVAARFQTAVIENDVYAGLRYRGAEVPSLKALDRDGRVIYMSSFSKVVCPGLRVGWCVAPRVVARRMAAAKQLTDLHTDQLAQAVLYRLAADGVLAEHRRQVVRHGTERLEAAATACRRDMPAGVEFHEPEGGMHLWLELPAPLSADELLARARMIKVVFVPGRLFSVTRVHHRSLRLSFAGLEPEAIRRGIRALGRLLRADVQAPTTLTPGMAPALV